MAGIYGHLVEVSLQRRDWILLALIVLLAGVGLWIDLASPAIAFWRAVPEGLPPEQARLIRSTTLRLGLDLQGGTQVILEAQVRPVSWSLSRWATPEGVAGFVREVYENAAAAGGETMEVARDIINDRVNGLGVTEAVVQVQGANRIIVELPGVPDPEQALATVQSTGFLEFVDTLGQDLPPGTVISTTYGLTAAEISAITWTQVYPTVVTGYELVSGQIGTRAKELTGEPMVLLGFNPEGTRKLAEWSRTHVGQPLAIVLDKKVISAPIVREAITDGAASISGGKMTWREAERIALLLRYGALPVPLTVVENRNVGPTLGQDSVNKSVVAGIIGLCTVLLFMTLYYRLPGVLAGLALCIYTVLIFALYKLIPVTLTLPGVAGLLLSIGMAVDANILIFERMKEELRAGKALRASIEAGFDRAWTSIWDSNLSTLLTCLILYLFGRSLGASMVKGFAITLAIGVAVSMFSAITVTRTFLRAVYGLLGPYLERHTRFLLGVALERP